MEIEEWRPPTEANMPVGPQSFPRTGVNSLATVGARAVARAIDAVLVALPVFLVAAAVQTLVNTGDDPMELGPQEYVAVLAPVLVAVVLYETVAVTFWGQTVGKLVVGIRVARQVNGRCPLWWEAALRIGLPAVIAAIPLPFSTVVAIGLFSTAGFDPLSRNIPDRAAGTVVVRAR